MKKIKLVIGDWSKDGHSQSEEVFINCNKTKEELNAYYRKSCLLAKVQFTENENLTGLELDWQVFNKHKILVEYGRNTITDFQKDLLIQAGIKEEDLIADEASSLVNLFLKFIKLTLPDLEWEITTSDIPTWNTGIGYGLFE